MFVKIYGGIAHKLAAESPADAERVLERIRGLDPVNGSHYVVAVCRGSRERTPSARRRIAETMLDAEWVGLKPYIYGLIARELAARDRPAAVRLLETAYDALDRSAGRGSLATLHSNPRIAAGLLPIAEEIAPERLAEFLARTLSLREPWLDEGGGASNADQAVAPVDDRRGV